MGRRHHYSRLGDNSQRNQSQRDLLQGLLKNVSQVAIEHLENNAAEKPHILHLHKTIRHGARRIGDALEQTLNELNHHNSDYSNAAQNPTFYSDRARKQDQTWSTQSTPPIQTTQPPQSTQVPQPAHEHSVLKELSTKDLSTSAAATSSALASSPTTSSISSTEQSLEAPNLSQNALAAGSSSFKYEPAKSKPVKSESEWNITSTTAMAKTAESSETIKSDDALQDKLKANDTLKTCDALKTAEATEVFTTAKASDKLDTAEDTDTFEDDAHVDIALSRSTNPSELIRKLREEALTAYQQHEALRLEHQSQLNKAQQEFSTTNCPLSLKSTPLEDLSSKELSNSLGPEEGLISNLLDPLSDSINESLRHRNSVNSALNINNADHAVNGINAPHSNQAADVKHSDTTKSDIRAAYSSKENSMQDNASNSILDRLLAGLSGNAELDDNTLDNALNNTDGYSENNTGFSFSQCSDNVASKPTNSAQAERGGNYSSSDYAQNDMSAHPQEQKLAADNLEESALASLRADRELAAVGSDRKLSSLGPDSELAAARADRALTSLGADSERASVGADRVLTSLGSDSERAVGSDRDLAIVGLDGDAAADDSVSNYLRSLFNYINTQASAAESEAKNDEDWAEDEVGNKLDGVSPASGLLKQNAASDSVNVSNKRAQSRWHKQPNLNMMVDNYKSQGHSLDLNNIVKKDGELTSDTSSSSDTMLSSNSTLSSDSISSKDNMHLLDLIRQVRMQINDLQDQLLGEKYKVRTWRTMQMFASEPQSSQSYQAWSNKLHNSLLLQQSLMQQIEQKQYELQELLLQLENQKLYADSQSSNSPYTARQKSSQFRQGQRCMQQGNLDNQDQQSSFSSKLPSALPAKLISDLPSSRFNAAQTHSSLGQNKASSVSQSANTNTANINAVLNANQLASGNLAVVNPTVSANNFASINQQTCANQSTLSSLEQELSDIYAKADSQQAYEQALQQQTKLQSAFASDAITPVDKERVLSAESKTEAQEFSTVPSKSNLQDTLAAAIKEISQENNSVANAQSSTLTASEQVNHQPKAEVVSNLSAVEKANDAANSCTESCITGNKSMLWLKDLQSKFDLSTAATPDALQHKHESLSSRRCANLTSRLDKVIDVSCKHAQSLNLPIDQVLTLPLTVFLGSAGVGKSTLCNQLLQSDWCKVGHYDVGTSAPSFYYLTAGGKPRMCLVDMPGTGVDDEQMNLCQEQYSQILPYAQLVVWIINAQRRDLHQDCQYFKQFVQNKPALIVLNQIDALYGCQWNAQENCPDASIQKVIDKLKVKIADQYDVPESKIIPISALKSYNTLRLLEEIIYSLKVD